MNLDQMQRLLDEFRKLPAEPVACDFNTLELVGLGRYEPDHNRLLAWLVDPGEAHGQGALFLKAFLDACGLGKVRRDVLQACRAKAHSWGGRAEVDIVITAGNQLLVYVENKVDAAEGSDQLEREFDDMIEMGRGLGVPASAQFPVFITPDGRRPRAEQRGDWRCISHALLADSLRAALPEVSSPKLVYAVEDWLGLLTIEARSAMRNLSKQSVFVGEHWRDVEKIKEAANKLEDELRRTLAGLQRPLASRDWWSRDWKFEWAGGRNPYVTKRDWGLGRSNLIGVGVMGFVPEAVFGVGAPPYVSVWVHPGRQPLLGQGVATAIASRELGRPGDNVQPDAADGEVVWTALPQWSRPTAGGYPDLVRAEALSFIDHYARVLIDLDDLIREHLSPE